MVVRREAEQRVEVELKRCDVASRTEGQVRVVIETWCSVVYSEHSLKNLVSMGEQSGNWELFGAVGVQWFALEWED